MPNIDIVVVPYNVKNKPESERGHTVIATKDGWVKESLNHDPDEVITESPGLDDLLGACNLDLDGVTKIVAQNPIGKTVTIEVYDPAAVNIKSLAISPQTWAGDVGSSKTFTAGILPANATHKELTWFSSDETVLKTGTNGAYQLLKAGVAQAFARTTDGTGLVARADVVVNAVAVVAVASVTVTPTTKALAVAATQQLTPTVLPANATNKAVTYQTSDATKATVSPTGLITGVAAGTATITVKTADGNKTATCVVTVS